MKMAELLADAFGRVHGVVHEVVDGCATEDLVARIDSEANSIAWLVWHLTRIQDDHIAGVAGVAQAYTSLGWAQRFAFPFDVSDTGYAHGPAQVAAVVTDGETLLGYHDAVYQNTLEFVGRLTDGDLDRIVDTNWDPPVTMGVRIVSVISDDLQHAGQAAYVRGILLDRS
jgi:uncharacterized damage-inducible protein DinB